MLAIVSDLHLQHVSDDVLHYRENGRLMAAGVHRNISASALRRFLHMAYTAAKQRGSRTLEIVFAGDIFELHRTPLWFYEADGVRPTDDPGSDRSTPTNHPLACVTDRILDRIHEENRDFFEALRLFVVDRQLRIDRRTRRITTEELETIRVHYVPGNHDRLANAWRFMRARIRDMLSIEPGGGRPFPNTIERRFGQPGEYGVRVRHGHEYEASNFPTKVKGDASLNSDWQEYLAPCFGDYATVDFATRLAVAFRAYQAKSLHQDTAKGRRRRDLYLALTEFDDVRPSSLVIEYLTQSLGATHNRVFKLLRPVLRDCVEAAVANPFLKAEARRLGYWKPVAIRALQEGLKHLSGDTIAGLADRLVSEKESGTAPADIARHEPELGDGVKTVVAGHTHHPDQVALPRGRRGRPYFLDSGTWRTTLPHGVESFGRLRAYTMVFCYDESERDSADGRSLETWTGHLQDESHGPYFTDVPGRPPGPGNQVLDLVALEIDQVDERRSELEVHLGVDGSARKLERDGVSRGQTLDLRHLAPVPLDRALDGELWFHGLELDLGNVFDAHDQLPWALHRLPRDGAERWARFRPGEDELPIGGWSEFRFHLKYRVRDLQ